MIPAPFEYARAGSVEEAISLLGSDPDAKILAGGHSLLPAMRLRIARPSMLVDIGRIAGLSYVREDGDRIAIGALTRHHDVANAGVHVGLTNMGLRPLRAAGVEEAVGGGADPASAAARADEGTAPPDDAFGSAEYRRQLVKVLVRRALEEALA